MADLTRAQSLWSGGKRLEAEREILELLRASPEDPRVLRALAEIYAASQRTPQSLELWRRLARLQPTDPVVLRHFAAALLAEQSVAAAIDVLRAAIALEPRNARSHNNLGLAQLRSGDAAGAAESLGHAIELDPGYALAHLNIGLALQQQNQAEAACASYRRALQLDPHLVQARVLLSELLRTSDADAARRERDRAIESHAINLMTMRRHDEAVALWSQLIDGGSALHYLEGMRFHCRLHCCDWSQYGETAARLEADVMSGRCVDLPFAFFVHSESAAAQLECARSYIDDRYPAAEDRAPAVHAAEAPRIRVAYLSFDFNEHATAYLAAGLLESHDRARYEIYALSYNRGDGSAMRSRLEAAVEHFIDVENRTDAEIAALTRSLGMHIAVDLKGLTGGARTGIFANRAAPVQINYLGYPGTMGAHYMDYIVADRHVIPDEARQCYREQVIYLPHSYQPNDARRARPTEGPGRAELGLPPEGFVYCCFNNLYKITPAVFDTWMSLLRTVPGSVLWLLEGAPAAMRNLRTAAASRGIEAGRLLFAPHIELAQHLARYRHADLFLDTAPCNAHTTASDALWMGVPVLTVTGRTFAGRVATSLLHAVDLAELCTASLEAYRHKALSLSTPAELGRLKAHLERGRGQFPLFDTAGYCRRLEAAYAEVWARQRRAEPPGALIVEA
jgi:predicted O-linked N-acetylglucosamine transferase (SPINDLY family)